MLLLPTIRTSGFLNFEGRGVCQPSFSRTLSFDRQEFRTRVLSRFGVSKGSLVTGIGVIGAGGDCGHMKIYDN